jgi:hypothetical protein
MFPHQDDMVVALLSERSGNRKPRCATVPAGFPCSPDGVFIEMSSEDRTNHIKKGGGEPHEQSHKDIFCLSLSQRDLMERRRHSYGP